MAFNTNIYTVAWSRLCQWLLPGALRTLELTTMLAAMVEPVKTLTASLLSFRQSKIDFLQVSPQVFSLENVLNNRFDADLRRIRIGDGTREAPNYVATALENQPLFVGKGSEPPPVFVGLEAESLNSSYDFIVILPTGLIYDPAEMGGLLNAFKLASKRYLISYE